MGCGKGMTVIVKNQFLDIPLAVGCGSFMKSMDSGLCGGQ